MTTDSITKKAKDTSDGSDENVVIADGKVLNNKKDTCKDKVIDEEYRLAVANLWKGIVEIPENWNDMTVREQRDWMNLQVNQHMTNMPRSLTFLVVGMLIGGDCGRPASAPRPDWLDHEKFLRGQRFAMNNLAAVFIGEVVALFGLYSFEDGIKPLMITGKSSDPFASFKRYMSTTNRIKTWYSSDPWTEGTPAYKNIQTVRRMHTIVKNKLIDFSPEDIDRASKIEKTWSTTRSTLLEDFQDSCPAAAPGQCPYGFSKDEPQKRPKVLNQSDMAATQSSFIWFVILHPEYFGIHGASDEDLDAFCHLWRGLGYLLGIEETFNFCNGTLEEVKQRSRDFLEYWIKPNLRNITPEWEHMMRCLTTGMGHYSPMMNYEQSVLYLAELLNIRLPRLEASLGYGEWLYYKLMKITLQWIARLPWAPAVMNQVFIFCTERRLKYTQEELEKMKKHLTIVMSKGIEETAAAQSNLATPNYWQKNSVFVLLSTCLLLSLPLVANEFAKMFLFINAESTLSG